MSGLTSLMGVAKSGLTAAQTAIAVTGENISNVDTEGYSRRTVTFAEAATYDVASGRIGNGVITQGIQRYFSQFVENQYYDQSSLASRWEDLYTNLSNTESLFNESSGYGISDTLSSFFSAWEDLTQSPENASSRNSVVTSSQTLASTLSQISSDLTTQQQQADAAIELQVSEVNSLLEQIAALNKQIKTTTADNNDLQDKRANLVRELATFIDIKYIQKSDGDVTITTGAGNNLVDGPDVFKLSYDGPRTVTALMPNSNYDGGVYYAGTDNQEYTLEVYQAGNVSSGAGAAMFRVSVDGGQTWLKDADGNYQLYAARTQDTATGVGELSIWFGAAGDSSTVPSTSLAVGDRFTITPMKAVYWNENTSTKENITPYTDPTGAQDTGRLTGGSLSALCSYKNDYLGAYKEKLDAMSYSLAWEVNRIHSQGTGLTAMGETTGSYSVKHDAMALGSNSCGLVYGSKLTSGSAFIYVYNDATGLVASGAALDFSGGLGLGANFDPATHSLNDVAAAVNNTFGSYLTATIVNHQLTISAKDGYSFNFGTDTTGIYAALGLNTYFTGSSATDLGINTAVSTNMDRMAVGHVDGAGQANKGDNTTAAAISDLASTKVDVTTLRGGTVNQSLGTYYSGLVSSVGADSAQAKYKHSYANTLASDLNDQQQAISGVNLDEEMTNLIKYQHAYTAAAKLITTADQMMQTLLSLKS